MILSTICGLYIIEDLYDMALEIEHKFLLKRFPDTKFDNKLEIVQFYCESPKVRIRRTFDFETEKVSYVQTIKTPHESGIGYYEKEKKLTRKRFFELYQIAYLTISKTRYLKKFGKLKWEIDVYDNMKLIVAELEVPKVGYKFNIPPYISKVLIDDVTKNKAFTNKSLAESFKPVSNAIDLMPKSIL